MPHGCQLRENNDICASLSFNPLGTATKNIGQKDNGPENRYQNYCSGLIYDTIEFEQWAGT